MKVKKLLKVLSPNTDIVFRDSYGGTTNIYASTNSTNIQEVYLERKVVRVWIDNDPFIILNIVIEGTID